jgi:hypothetical protein
LSVPAFGAFCLGIFVAYMVWYFVVRLQAAAYTVKTLSAVLALIAGGVVIRFLESDQVGKGARWWYPIGLVAGLVLFAIARLTGWGPTRSA